MKSVKTLALALVLGLSAATSANALELDKQLNTAPEAAKTNFVKLEYAFRDYDADQPNKNGLNLTVGGAIAPRVALDLKTEFRVENGSETTSNRIEAGATYAVGTYNDVAFTVRGAVGEKFTNGDRYSYYAIEPGASYAVNDKLSLNTAYRFRTAFSDSYDDETHQVKVGAAYKVSQNTAILASVGRSWGDSQYNSFNLGYGIKF